MRLLMIGFGAVAQGLAELLIDKRDELAATYGFEWTVVGIADMLKGSAYHPDGIKLGQALAMAGRGESLSTCPEGGCDWDAPRMIAEAEADVMLEATYTDITTAQPATDHIRCALKRGMHVATTNKGPLALHAAELGALAAEHGVRLLYEGTVLAGTPLLNLIRETLAGSRITEMQGILNGTTNYILTEMEAGLDYASALARAQELGYAEAIPDADVKGLDALAKVTILANTVLGASLRPSDCSCEGITGITPAQIATAGEQGRRFKLIGRVWLEDGTVRAEVGPRLVEITHPLAGVAGATNAVTIHTDTLGEVTIQGPGAGRTATGFALLNDLLYLRRHTS